MLIIFAFVCVQVELQQECDYVREAELQMRFRDIVR